MKFLDSILAKKKPRLQDGNPALVQAMNELALKDNSENRRNLYVALLGSVLLIPVPEIPSGLSHGVQASKAGLQIQFTGMLDRNQRRVTPAFTDIEALQNWDPNTPYLGLNAQDFFRLVRGTDIQEIVINPFDPIRKMLRPGGRVTRAEFDLLSEGIPPTRVGPKGVQFQLKPNERVAIGLPAERPSTEIEDSLRSKASEVPEIDKLYLFQMATQAGSSHTVVGIQLNRTFSREQEDEIARRLADNVQARLEKGRSLDFLILRGSIRDQVRVAGVVIFYR